MDLLDFVIKAQLSQLYRDRIWHLVVYYSRKLISLKLNYNIYNKELLAIVVAFKE